MEDTFDHEKCRLASEASRRSCDKNAILAAYVRIEMFVIKALTQMIMKLFLTIPAILGSEHYKKDDVMRILHVQGANSEQNLITGK